MTTTPNEIVLEGFDVDTYASKYSGRNKIDRLLFVAEGSPCVRKHALSTLLRVLKDSINMSLYSQIAEKLSAISPESVTLDRMHMEQVKRSCMQRQERLEQELNSYKSSMIKESIRVSFYVNFRLYNDFFFLHMIP
jgi:COP9 signalosome complex subunit 1